MSKDLAINKLKFRGNKASFGLAIVLLLSLTSVFVAFTPAATAQLRTQQTWAFISTIPNPVGVAQTIHIRIFLQPFPPTGADVYHNFQCIITKPDGTKKTSTGLTSDPNGAYDLTFTPTATGNYTVEFNYPGETFSSANVTDSASSATATFAVQTDPIQPLPDAPLPTDYWTRPISEEFRSWYSISGNWLSQGYDASGRIYCDSTGFNPYTQAVLAPHIAWMAPIADGGLIGGSYGSDGFYSGIQYNGLATPPLIVNGRLYYRLFMSSSGEKGNIPGFTCVDLRTGQQLWSNTTGNINFAQVYNSKGYNGQGGISMLYDVSTTTWVIYDAFSGTPLYYLANATASPDKVFYGPLGDVYAVKASGTTNVTITMWNSTKAFQAYGFLSGGTFQGPGRPGIYNWALGLQYTVSAPGTKPFTLSQTGPHNMPADASTNTILLIATPPDTPNNGSSLETAVNILTGSILWGPIRRDFDGTFTNRVATGEGLYVQLNAATLQRVGISFTTGAQLWVSDPRDNPWAQYSGFGANAYGITYQGDYGGTIVALNATTGQKVWSFNAGNSGVETPYGSWPMFNGPIVGGGTVYCGYSEHTPNEPLYRGAQLFALDAMTGTKLWSMPSYLAVKALADGYLVTVNAYDNRMVVFGKGPSKTTVEAPLTAIVQGQSFTVTGTVTDQSPGQPDTPAISDANMSAWMEYLHMQKEFPTNAKGVVVQLSAIDPNGNYDIIGNATSNTEGSYGISWVPPVPGLYQISASFAGSNSYGSSAASTYITVSALAASPAPTAIPVPTQTPTPNPTASPVATPSVAPTNGSGAGISTEYYIVIAAVVIIIAIVAVAVLLRRRK